MKKLILLFLLVGLVVGSVPALAGNGDLDWTATKTIKLTETFDYTEKVEFSGTGLFLFDGEAWAKIQEQQELYKLTLTFGDVASSTTKKAEIDSSFNQAVGIANVNQSPGYLNNQGNETAFSIGQTGTDAPAETNTFQGMFCEAQVVSVQYNGIIFSPTGVGELGGTRADGKNTLTTGNQITTDAISASFDTFQGIANVNQSAGNLNNQGNAVAIAGGVNQVVVKAATDIMLSQANAFNTLNEGNNDFDSGNQTKDSINSGSFNSSFGVSNVNQAAGSLNNQKNVVAISFAGFAR